MRFGRDVHRRLLHAGPSVRTVTWRYSRLHGVEVEAAAAFVVITLLPAIQIAIRRNVGHLPLAGSAAEHHRDLDGLRKR
jgi:hypothetical protein